MPQFTLNKVLLVGNVGKEPEIRYIDNNGSEGTKVATFTMATAERFKSRSGEWQENTEWHNIIAWRQQADLIEKFVHMGSYVLISGRIRRREYTGKDGSKRTVTEIMADSIGLLGNAQTEEGKVVAAARDYAQARREQAVPQTGNNEDLPF